MGKIDSSIDKTWRGYIVEFNEDLDGCLFRRKTTFGADMFVGTRIEGGGEIYRCSKDERGLFIIVRWPEPRPFQGRWTYTHDALETRYELDPTSGESRCIIVKCPLRSISYEQESGTEDTPYVVYIGA